ncbi:MAG: hypothetical protein KAG98_06450, partial [Lentisphaeria bacterium]|nr:hypothetical protein [Lentisphaeria bacterium]
ADIWGNGLNSDGKAGQSVSSQFFYYHRNDLDSEFDLTDLDKDGLPDAWEIYHFGDITSVKGSDIYPGSELTYKEVYYSGKLPMNFTLKLKAGWNLISIPTTVSETPVERSDGSGGKVSLSTLDVLIKQIHSPFYYNATTQRYEPLDLSQNINSSQGFWAFSFEDQKAFTFKGVQPYANQTDYLPGWNLFGSNCIRKVPNATTLGPVFDWAPASVDADYETLPSNSDVSPLKGYWIKNVTEETTRPSN